MRFSISAALSLLLSLSSCIAPTDPSSGGAPALEAGQTILHFDGSWSEWVEGPLQAGRAFTVDYDASRLPCRDSRGGRPAWSIAVHYRIDGGAVVTQSIAGHEAFPGAHEVELSIDGPGTLELWFESTSVSGCHEWDSNFGANYVFQVDDDPGAPDWMGNATSAITRSSSCGGTACDGDRRPLDQGFRYDTWARQRALVRVLAFDVWEPGVTDHDNPDLWRELDVRVHYRYGAEGEWQWKYVDFARRVGNDARYEVQLRQIDPQGGSTIVSAEQCPDVPLIGEASGFYVQTPIELYFTVNGAALRAPSGANFTGTFEDYRGLYAPCAIQ
jgi:hypothetical protein